MASSSEYESPVGNVFYRVWWALGGYTHFDYPIDNTVKHPKANRDIDEPVRIDKIEVIYNDETAERRVQDKRRAKWNL